MSGLAVVTGASSGIGHELAKQLAAGGHDLLLVARREERLRQVADEVHAQNGIKAEFLKLDLTVTHQRHELISTIIRERSRLSLMINNAGFGAVRCATDIATSRTMEMIELNVSALTELCIEAAKLLVSRKAGGIINVASTAAFQPVPYMAVYAATKAYVLSFTEALGEELSGSGVRVMALCPGYTATEFQQVAGERPRGSKRPMMSPVECVRIGLRDYEAGKRVSVTGLSNKIQTSAGRLLPRGFITNMAGRFVKSRIG